MGEDDPVPVQVEDPHAPAGARDADQLGDRLLRLGQVRQRGDRQDHVEGAVGEGQRLGLAHPKLHRASQPVPLDQLGRHGQQAGARVQPHDPARWTDQPGSGAGDRAAAAADVEHAAPGDDAGELQVGGACRHLLGVPRAQLQQRGQLADLCAVGPGAVAPQVEPPVARAGVGRRRGMVVGLRAGGRRGRVVGFRAGRRHGRVVGLAGPAQRDHQCLFLNLRAGWSWRNGSPPSSTASSGCWPSRHTV
jgi:hypothetical protein